MVEARTADVGIFSTNVMISNDESVSDRWSNKHAETRDIG